MPDELWSEVCDIVQEAVIKTIPKKKKYKTAKWLSEKALQTVEKSREVKSEFKGLDLIDRVPDELWMEVCEIVQEAVIKTIPKKKKCKKAKWLSEETLQIAVKRREAKSKGEKERYTHLRAEFEKNSKER